MKRCLLILLLFSTFLLPCRMAAMDPVTLAVLAPIAVKGAKIASPYALRGMQCTARRFVTIGTDVVDVCKMPLGVVQCTLGVPFGMLGEGLHNVLLGGMAPFKLTWDVLLLPLSFFGIAG